MGQVALGFRSLLTKAAVFFVMAALLAWALGGTLWPRPQVVYAASVATKGTTFQWRLVVSGTTEAEARWTMMNRHRGGQISAFPLDEEPLEFLEISGPVVLPEGTLVAFAGRPIDPVAGCEGGGAWCLFIADAVTTKSGRYPMPDRLAVEQQLARLAAGLHIQEHETIVRQRSIVLDPADEG